METKEGIFARTLRELAYYLYLAYMDIIKELTNKRPKIDFLREIKILIDRKYQLE